MRLRSSRVVSAAFFLIPAAALLCSVAAQTTFAQSAADASDLAAHIQRVENGIPPISLGGDQPAIELNLPKLMELYKIPGLSIAVVDHFKIVWAKGYGVTEVGKDTPVTTRTLFQAGSISKPVTAAGALFLVEHEKLSLDEDVNRQLKSWKVPDNEFTKAQKVTLRRIQSHSAGLTVHGFPGYGVGAPVPTLVQVLNGEKPAITAPVRVDSVPGSKFNYSGGGVTIEQLLMTEVTGKPFPQLMQEIVLSRAGMTDSTFEQPLPPAKAALAASGTSGDGKVIPGRWHIYPEMAAAGLWTTPTDLAKFGIETALSRRGQSNEVLTWAMTREMLKPQIEQVGLGFFLGQGDNPAEFGHDGADEGFQASLIMLADTGQGVAIMANSDNGLALAGFLTESVAKEYGWKYKSGEHNSEILWLIASSRSAHAAMDEYSELKKSAHDIDQDTLLGVAYRLLSAGKSDDALQVFKLEVREYPNYWNAYDSLGEAYMKAGQKDLAILNYRKSIELKPDNQNGIEMLKRLRKH